MLLPTIGAYLAAAAMIAFGLSSVVLAIRAYDYGKPLGPARPLGAAGIAISFGFLCGALAGGRALGFLPGEAQLLLIIALIVGFGFGFVGLILPVRDPLTIRLPGGRYFKLP